MNTTKIDKALSFEDVHRLMNGKIRVMTYDQLHNFDNIIAALGKYEAAVILFITNREGDFGHYTLCFTRKGNPKHGEPNKKLIEFFDSYGMYPDKQRSYISRDIQEMYKEDRPYLLDMLKKSGYPVCYNEYPLQDINANTSTCGRWCILRCKFRNISIDEFADPFLPLREKDAILPDLIVSNLI